MLKRIYANWTKHEAPRLGAALAFYTILSLSPLLVLSIAIAAFFFDRSTAMRQVTYQVQGFVGEAAAKLIQSTLESTQKNQTGGQASLISAFVLLFGASGVFSELRSALNKIWEVEEDPNAGVWALVKDKLFSFGMVLSVGFLLIAALIMSAVLAAISTFLNRLIPIPPPIAFTIDLLVSLAGIAAIFTLIYRFVPSVRIPWNKAWVGGAVTSVLFALGKYVILFYLAKAAPGSAYGAAGSVVAVIVWVYYTAQIVFFGAEFTHVYATKEPLPKTAKHAPDHAREPLSERRA